MLCHASAPVRDAVNAGQGTELRICAAAVECFASMLTSGMIAYCEIEEGVAVLGLSYSDR